MRALTFAALLFIAGFASAETLTFTGSPCNANRDCSPVETDSLDAVVWLSARLNTRPVIVVDGISYTGTVFDVGGENIDQAVVDADGNVAHLSVQFLHSVRKVNMGRAHYYIQKWAIISGSFESPPLAQ